MRNTFDRHAHYMNDLDYYDEITVRSGVILTTTAASCNMALLSFGQSIGTRGSLETCC